MESVEKRKICNICRETGKTKRFDSRRKRYKAFFSSPKTDIVSDKPYLSVVPPHVQPVVAQQGRALVDVVDGQFDGRHDAATDPAFGYAAGHAAAEREEAGYVHVVSLVGRGSLPGRAGRAPTRHQQTPQP